MVLLAYDIDKGVRYAQVREQRTKEDYAQFIDQIARQYDSGKKKRHTHKMQLVVSRDGTIICPMDPAGVHIDKGRKHDFRLFKQSEVHVHVDVCIEADAAYQGINKYHRNSIYLINTPKIKHWQRSNNSIIIPLLLTGCT